MYCYEISESVKNRFFDWWNCKNETPLLSLHSKKTFPRVPCIPPVPKNLEDRWKNEKFLYRSQKFVQSNAYCIDVAFPIYNPNLGPDILGACGIL